MKKLVAVVVAVLLVGVSVGGCTVETQSTKSGSNTSQSQEDGWSSWAATNKSDVELASSELRKAETGTTPSGISIPARHAGFLLENVSDSPDGGVVSDYLHTGGESLIKAADSVDAGDIGQAKLYFIDASTEINRASTAMDSATTSN